MSRASTTAPAPVSIHAPAETQLSHLTPPSAADFAMGAYLTTVPLAVTLITTPQAWHWFVIPAWMCGALVAVDLVRWLRGRARFSDARTIVALAGFHFFLLAPLLHVALDTWMTFITPPPDWRPYLGRMAALNALGLIGYRLAIHQGSRAAAAPTHGRWTIDKRLLMPTIYLLLTLAVGAQLYNYVRFGGITAFIQDFSSESIVGFAGSGWLTIIAESFPLFCLLLFAIRLGSRSRPPSLRMLGLAAVVFLGLLLFFGGVRGSRANIIWPLLIAAVLIDLKFRRVSRAAVACAIAVLVVFSYSYGFYKAYGLDGITAITDRPARTKLEDQTGWTLEATLLADLGRADVQAFLNYRMYRPDSDYELAFGRTYLGALVLPIPKQIWAGRPMPKTLEGTEAQFGKGQRVPGGQYSSRIYGLAGEAMLNFGWPAVPLVLTLFGWLVARVEQLVTRWRCTDDARMLIAPILVVGLLFVLIQDSDVIMFACFKYLALPFGVLAIGCRRSRRKATLAA